MECGWALLEYIVKGGIGHFWGILLIGHKSVIHVYFFILQVIK